jgi:hypothetical protein
LRLLCGLNKPGTGEARRKKPEIQLDLQEGRKYQESDLQNLTNITFLLLYNRYYVKQNKAVRGVHEE